MSGSSISAAVVDEPLWTAQQVAEYLRISKSLVYDKAASGELPSVTVFSRRRFEPAVIREFARGSGSGLARK